MQYIPDNIRDICYKNRNILPAAAPALRGGAELQAKGRRPAAQGKGEKNAKITKTAQLTSRAAM